MGKPKKEKRWKREEELEHKNQRGVGRQMERRGDGGRLRERDGECGKEG